MVPALLDTCVLWPQLLTDTLLRLAAGQTYQPRWSADILEELRRNLVPRTGTAAAQRRLYRMQQAFPLAEITGYEHLVESMTNDPKDRHVLAAAVHANAEVIVTYNLTDFPQPRARAARHQHRPPRCVSLRAAR